MEIDKIISDRGYKLSDILSSSRKSELVALRVYAARRLHQEGLRENKIAKLLNRDRTTIIYYLRNWKETEFFKEL